MARQVQPGEASAILTRLAAGEQGAADELWPLVYAELRALAQSYLERERADHTLQATALVHEAYLKLVDQKGARWKGRSHFFAVAAQAIRRILVDHARTKNRLKRGGALERLTLDESITPPVGDGTVDMLALEDALAHLATLNERHSRLVELRFYGGLSMPEVAEVMGMPLRTLEAEWAMARAWLARELGQSL
jgi:RNA polymerase sigma-70 factor, ECF subfamily